MAKTKKSNLLSSPMYVKGPAKDPVPGPERAPIGKLKDPLGLIPGKGSK